MVALVLQAMSSATTQEMRKPRKRLSQEGVYEKTWHFPFEENEIDAHGLLTSCFHRHYGSCARFKCGTIPNAWVCTDNVAIAAIVPFDAAFNCSGFRGTNPGQQRCRDNCQNAEEALSRLLQAKLNFAKGRKRQSRENHDAHSLRLRD
jgi:hypothetical protein